MFMAFVANHRFHIRQINSDPTRSGSANFFCRFFLFGNRFSQVMMHFPTASASLGALDDWGQVQLPSSVTADAAAALKPRVVHRGLEGLPDIPDGEPTEVDHLVFVVHGIGAACDIKFRSSFFCSRLFFPSSPKNKEEFCYFISLIY